MKLTLSTNEESSRVQTGGLTNHLTVRPDGFEPFDIDKIYERWEEWARKEKDFRDNAWSHMCTFSNSSLPPPY